MNAGTAQYFSNGRLRDGTAIVIRSIGSEDKSILIEVMHHLSPQSRYFRFLTPKNEPTEEDLAIFANVDARRHFALVACFIEDGKEKPLGLGEYFVTDEPSVSAELAFAVEDEFHGRGVATALLHHLAIIARRVGVTQFTALVHAENRKMLEVFANSGFAVDVQESFATVQLRLKLCDEKADAVIATEITGRNHNN